MQPVDPEEAPTTSKCSTFLYYTWKICTCIFSHVVLVSLVVAYCILGAYTFKSLEAEHELDVKRGIVKIRDNVTEDLWKITTGGYVLHEQNWTHNVVQRLKKFETELLKAMKKDGWDGSEDPESVQWTFAGALFYSIIVITTIGEYMLFKVNRISDIFIYISSARLTIYTKDLHEHLVTSLPNMFGKSTVTIYTILLSVQT